MGSDPKDKRLDAAPEQTPSLLQKDLQLDRRNRQQPTFEQLQQGPPPQRPMPQTSPAGPTQPSQPQPHIVVSPKTLVAPAHEPAAPSLPIHARPAMPVTQAQPAHAPAPGQPAMPGAVLPPRPVAAQSAAAPAGVKAQASTQPIVRPPGAVPAPSASPAGRAPAPSAPGSGPHAAPQARPAAAPSAPPRPGSAPSAAPYAHPQPHHAAASGAPGSGPRAAPSAPPAPGSGAHAAPYAHPQPHHAAASTAPGSGPHAAPQPGFTHPQPHHAAAPGSGPHPAPQARPPAASPAGYAHPQPHHAAASVAPGSGPHAAPQARGAATPSAPGSGPHAAPQARPAGAPPSPARPGAAPPATPFSHPQPHHAFGPTSKAPIPTSTVPYSPQVHGLVAKTVPAPPAPVATQHVEAFTPPEPAPAPPPARQAPPSPVDFARAQVAQAVRAAQAAPPGVNDATGVLPPHVPAPAPNLFAPPPPVNLFAPPPPVNPSAVPVPVATAPHVEPDFSDVTTDPHRAPLGAPGYAPGHAALEFSELPTDPQRAAAAQRPPMAGTEWAPPTEPERRPLVHTPAPPRPPLGLPAEFMTTQPGAPSPLAMESAERLREPSALSLHENELNALQSAERGAEGAVDETVAPREVIASPASVVRRLFAWLVDLIVVSGLALGLLVVAALVVGKGGPDHLVAAVTSVAPLGAGLAAFIAVAYTTLFAFLWQGRTVGRRLLGIRLVTSQGTPPGPLRSLLRAALSLVSFGLFLSGFWLALFDRRGQTLHDKLTRTFVVRLGASAP